jgi:Mg2+ and Co2+ transporter CorA
MLKLKYEMSRYERDMPLDKDLHNLNSRDFCFAILNKVSRSFALVIQELPEELRLPVTYPNPNKQQLK